MKPYLFFRLANYLYKYNSTFWVYFPLYIFYKRITDRTERQLFRCSVNPGDCVADIGANIGIHTRYFSELVGESGEVHAFEPDMTNFRRLTQYTRHLRNVQRHQMAIGNHTGKILLYLSEDLNVAHKTYRTEESRESREIDCIRLDDYFQGKKVDFIKMDIEGYEYEALQGMEHTLMNNSDIQMLMEFWPYGIRKAGNDKHAVVTFLKECGFHISLLLNNRIVPFTEDIIRCGVKDYYNMFVTRQKVEY